MIINNYQLQMQLTLLEEEMEAARKNGDKEKEEKYIEKIYRIKKIIEFQEHFM